MDSKICTVCKIKKNVTEFHKDPSRKFGVSHRCKECHCAESKRRWEAKKKDPYWDKKFKEQAFKAHCKRKYNITPEEYDALKKRANGLCECCGLPPKNGKPLHVDHCHKTGLVRGMLCVHCNLRLGFLENPTTMAEALAYLQKHRKE